MTKPTSRYYYRDAVASLSEYLQGDQLAIRLPSSLIRLLAIVNNRGGFGYVLPRGWFSPFALHLYYAEWMHLAECLDERRFTPNP